MTRVAMTCGNSPKTCSIDARMNQFNQLSLQETLSYFVYQVTEKEMNIY